MSNVTEEQDVEVIADVQTLTDKANKVVASLNSSEVKQGFMLVACKVPAGMSIEFLDDSHSDMLLTAAEITADGGNVNAEKIQHIHKAIETAVKGACRTAVAGWDKLVSDVSKANPKLTREEAIAHALKTVGRAEKIQKIAGNAARMLESLR